MNEFSCNRRLKVGSRREFLAKSSFGFGSMALSYLLGRDLAGAATISGNFFNPLVAKPPHFPAKAKRVIFIFLQGGPSQVDTFDPKPELTRLDGKFLPPSFLQGDVALAQIKANEARLMGTKRTFRKCGKSGLE